MRHSYRDLARTIRKALFRQPLTLQTLEERTTPDIGGTLFRDNNFDGAFSVANDHGFFAGVTVTAYDAVGNTSSATTGIGGVYSIPTAGLTGPFRIEVAVPSGFVAGPIGKDNLSTVRFVTDPNATGVTFGLVNPRDYSQSNPDLFTAQYDFGAATSSQAAILRFPYSNNGYFTKASAPYPIQTTPSTLAKVNQVGSVYGLARQAESDTIFAGAFVRRFVGSGPSGPGAIYTVAGNGSQSVSTLVDFNDLGNAKYAGMIPAGSTAADFAVGIDTRLGVAGYDYFSDTKGISLSHRIGLGDLDLSPDAKTIFTVNLRTRELIEVPVTLSGTLDTTRPFRRSSVPLTSASSLLNFNNPQDVRPFAIDIQDGVVFVGSTYTAEMSKVQSDLRAYVYAFDTATGQFRGYDQTTNQFTATLAPVLSADLSYDRQNGTVSGTTIYDTLDNAPPIGTTTTASGSERNRDDDFLPWNSTTNLFRNHQPLLTDIEFDRNVMVLGIRDRHGDQVGWFGASPPVPDRGSGEGDVLRAHPDNAGSFVLESNGISNGVPNAIYDAKTNSGAGSGTAKYLPQGPGGARFYWSNNFYQTDVDGENYGFAHGFLTMGALFQVPGGTRLATTIMDPLRYSSGGVSWFDNLTGSRPQNFELYADGELGKANGLGDLEAFENVTPLEIGNLLWQDFDRDGIQDPGDLGIANVNLEFWDLGDDGVVGGSGANADTKLATAMTDANGNYLFSGFAGTSTTSAIYNLNIRPNRNYEVRIPSLVGQAALAGLTLTKADQTDGNLLPDVRDSDATDVANVGVIRVTTGARGSIDHTFDAGFQEAQVKVSLGNLIWNDLNNDGIVTLGEPGLDGIAVSLFKDLNGDGVIDGTDPLVGTKTTAGGGLYQFDDLDPGKYIVAFTPPAGFLSSTGQFGNAASGPYEPGITIDTNDADHGTLVGTRTQTKSVELFISGNAANPDAGNTANFRQDFGLFRPYALGNKVWLDANNDGQITTGEAGIDGVTVRLLDEAGTKTLLTTTTANGGYYRFDTLTAGKYIVELNGTSAALNGLKSSTGSLTVTGPYEPAPAVNAKGDRNDYGSLVGTDFRSGVVTIGDVTGGDTEPAGETDFGPGDAAKADLRTDLTIDFGFVRPMSLGNRLFIDLNNSGVFDAGDANGPANATVNLLDSAGTFLTSTTTNAQGYYLFTNLYPGKYIVEVAKANFGLGGPLQGFVSSTGGGNGSTSGIFEPIATLAGDDRDSGSTLANSSVRAVTVTLTSDAAPIGEVATPGIVDPANDANGNLTVDFGFVRVLTLGNLVFDDANNNGQLGAGEPGLANVTVALIPDANSNDVADDAVILTTTTNSTGYYQFTNLFEGNYFVRILPPAGYVSSSGTNGSVSGPYEPAAGPNDKKDQFDDGSFVAVTGFVISQAVTLAFGGAPLAEPPSTDIADLATDANSNRTVDFGLYRPLSLGNRVWDDLDNDGLRGAAEPGLANVPVTLYDAVSKLQIATTKTDSAGHYLFPYLGAGSYFVEVIPPASYASSTGGAASAFEPAPAASPNDNLDDRDDGTQFTGTLVRSNTVTLAFDTEPAGELDVGSGSKSDPAADKSSNLTVDFGLFRALSIGNVVFHDKNNSGTFDAGEVGLGNVVVRLWSDPDGDGVPNAKITSTTTNAQGGYLFTGLGQGQYVVEVDPTTLPAGYWVSSSGKNGSLTGPSEPAPASANGKDQVDDGTAISASSVLSGPIALAAGTAPTGEVATPGLTDPTLDANGNLTIDFGFYRPLSIGNQVFFDANNNGTFDPALETGLGNVPVRLILDVNGNNVADDPVFASMTTLSGLGSYLFTTLLPGTYFVEIDAPSGFVSSTGKNGNATAGPFEPASVTGIDRTDHGTTIAGATIRSGPVILAAGSMPTGEPGDIRLTDPTPDNAANYTIDFGLWRPLSLGNQVWFDANNDGLLNNGETGIADVPVNLYDPIGTLIATTKTASDGTYLFTNLGAGDYSVEIVAPVGFASSSNLPGSFTGPSEPAGDPDNDTDNDDNGTAIAPGDRTIRTGLVTLAPGSEPNGNGDANLSVDFGLFRTMSLGNLVWNDANNNGLVDNAETGIANVSVRLSKDANGDGVPDGAAIQTTTTDANGNYLFTQLIPGKFIVEVADPLGFVPSSGKNGSLAAGPYQPAPSPDSDFDSDDNGSLVTGTPGVVRSGTITLSSGQEPNDAGDANLTVDFGYFRPLSLGNLVWNDANNNGVVDVGEKGLANVPLELRSTAGVVIATTTTDANGNYLFANLVDGDYVVRAELPAGFTGSTGGYGSTTPYEPAADPDNDLDNDDNGTAVSGQTVTSLPITLTRGGEPGATSDNLTLDFGAFRPLSLGNRVFFDLDNDGKQGGSETGIAGVTVRLFRDPDRDGVPNGAAIATQLTNATGHYLFTGLAEGNFVVEVDTPAGYRTSTGKNASITGPYEPAPLVDAEPAVDGDDNGSVLSGVVRSTTITLTVGGEPVGEAATTGIVDATPDADSNLTVDFGFMRPMAIGDRVFDDRNNDGQQGAGEPGLPNVTVRLLDPAGTTIATTVTNANGDYRFDNVSPGQYVVEIDPLAGYVSSTGGVFGSGPFEPAPAPTGKTNGFDTGTTTGTTIRSGTVTLALDAAPITDGDTDPNTDLTIDFGLFRPLTIGNQVWNDLNNNGLFDTGEPGLGAVTVNLWSDPEGDGVPNAKLATTATNGNGAYLFTGLGEGNYVVQVDGTTLPTGFITSSGKNGSLTGPFEPAPNNATDANDNGSLVNGLILSGPIALAVGTAPTGEPVTPGIADPAADANSNVTVDFGFYRPLSLGNLVWSDFNNNGKVDTGEPGLPNRPVQLFDGKGTAVASTTTDANGNYRFNNLTPGDYYVEVQPGAGVGSSTGTANAYEPGVAANGDIDNDDNGTLTAGLGSIVRSTTVTLTQGGEPAENGTYNPTLDIGLLATAKVSGFVYIDPNIDGKFVTTAGDSPLGGVTVTISGTDAGGNIVPPRTTRTDATGFYQFTDLPPGTYTIRETQPGGILVDGIDTIGSLGGTTPSNDTHTVTLAPNDNGQNYNFGEIPPANAFGNVYVDSNRNGRPDPGERPIPGVAITISGTAFAGTPIARPITAADVPGGSLTIVTNGAGRWEFPVLPPGNYTFVETQPRAFQDAREQNGDPQTSPIITNDQFAGVLLRPFPIGGPYNFGEIDPNETDGGKRDFLGSTVPGTNSPIVVPDGDRPLLQLPLAPSYPIRSGNVNTPTFVAYGSGPGATPLLRVFDYATGTEKFRQFAYESTFLGGVRTATGDINGDGIEDIVTSTGPGGGPRIRAFSGDDGRAIVDTFVFESTFRGGVFVATGDVNGDGRADIIVGAEIGGGPRVRAFDGVSGAELMNFFAFDSNQRGGVRVAAADFNNDGRADIVATTGVGVATRVRVINAATMATLADFAPYEAGYTGGVFVAAGDVTGDGTPDIVVGSDQGGGPRVQLFSGSTFTQVNNFFAFEPTFTGGVRVATADLNNDGRAEVIVAAGPGGAPRSRIYQGPTLTPLEDFYPFDPEFIGGSYVG